MTPDFALSLSSDRLRLLQRADAGWLLVGEVVLPTQHLRTEMSELRARGEALNGGPFQTKLLIPNEQIRYLTLADPDAGETEVRAALEGATPYPVEDLVFDRSRGGGRTYVAAVARETLAEAEAFAREHRMNPVSFAAAPEPFTFAGEAVFGPSSAGGGKVLRDPDPVRVVGVARLPEPQSRTEPAFPAPELVETPRTPAPISFRRSQTVAPPPPELVGLSAPDGAATQTTTGPHARAADRPDPSAPVPAPSKARGAKPAGAGRAAAKPDADPRPTETTPALTDRAVDFQARLRARIAEQGLDKRLPRSAVPRPAFQDDPPPPPGRPPRRSWREALRAAKGMPLSDDPPGTEMPSAPTVSFRHAVPGKSAGVAAVAATQTVRAEPRISFGAQALKQAPEPAPAPAVDAPQPEFPEPEAGAATARDLDATAAVPWTRQLSRDTAPPPAAPPLRATNAPPAELTFELADKFPEPERRRPWLLGALLTVLLLGTLAVVGSLATGGTDGLARLLGRGEETAAGADGPTPPDPVVLAEPQDVVIPQAIPSVDSDPEPATDSAAAGDTGGDVTAGEDLAAPRTPEPDVAATVEAPAAATPPADRADPTDPAQDLAAAVANSIGEAPTEAAPDPFDVLADTLAAADGVTAGDGEFVPAAPQFDVPSGLTLVPGATDSGSAPTGTDSGPSFSAPQAMAPGAGGEASGVGEGTTRSADLPGAAAPAIGEAATQPAQPAPTGAPSGPGALDAVGTRAAPGGLTAPGGLADLSRPEVDTANPAPPEPEVLEAPPIRAAEPLGRVLSPAEAQRIYAATGVWQRAPRLPVTPRTAPDAELSSGATETLDTVTRPRSPELDLVASFDSPLPVQVNPPAAGTVFERDDRGFVIATAEGSATPDGILVYAGAPSLQPPIRPGTEPPPFDPASLAETGAAVTDTGAAVLVAGRLATRVPVRPGSAPQAPDPVAEPAAEPAPSDDLSGFMAALGDALTEEAARAPATEVAVLDRLPAAPPTRPAAVAPANADPAPTDLAVLAALPTQPPSRPAALAPSVPEPPAAEVGNRLDSLPARPPSRPGTVGRAAAPVPEAEAPASPADEPLPPTPDAGQEPLPPNVQRLAALPVTPVLRPAILSTRASAAPATAALGAPIVNPPTRPETLAAAPVPETPAPEAPAPETTAPDAALPAGVQRLDSLPLRPPSRPAAPAVAPATPPAETAPEATEDSPLLFLDRAAVRPQPRPGLSNEDLASSTLAALTRTQPATSATPGAVTLEALLRPAARPSAPPAAATDSGGTGDLAASLRPQARPGDTAAEETGEDAAAQAQAEIAAALAAAAITLESSVPSSATATAQAVAISPRPDQRPRNMDAIVQRARAETARLAARQETQTPAVAARTVQPTGTTATNVAAAATQDGAINLGRINLIGVAGSDGDRRALVRLANGRMQRVGVGDRLDGGQVQSIGDDSLTYVRSGRAVRLDMPG